MDEEPQEIPQEVSEDTDRPDTKHEAHTHARPRLIWGVAAVVLVAVGCMVWLRWGEEIKEACLGEEGACTVELGDVPEGGAAFVTTEDFE